MALSSETRRSPRYIGTGSETIFPFAFKLLKPTDLEVRVALSGQVETTLEESAYTVVLNESQDNNPGGTVTLKAPLAKDAALVIISDTPYLQPTTYTNRGGFYPEQLNTNLDRLTILTQQLKEHLDRTITVPPTSPTSPQELFYQLLNAAKEALESAQSAEEALAACEQIRQLIEQYSWGIPHLADNLQQVADYPYDGYFWVSSFGKVPPGQDISNRYVKANGSTTQRTLGERFADVVNVRDFGAIGNGTTDDTAAFSAAGEAAIEGGTVYVPAGTYVLGGRIFTKPVNFVGAGQGATILKIEASGDSHDVFVFKENLKHSSSCGLQNLSIYLTKGHGRYLVDSTALAYSLLPSQCYTKLKIYSDFTEASDDSFKVENSWETAFRLGDSAELELSYIVMYGSFDNTEDPASQIMDKFVALKPNGAIMHAYLSNIMTHNVAYGVEIYDRVYFHLTNLDIARSRKGIFDNRISGSYTYGESIWSGVTVNSTDVCVSLNNRYGLQVNGLFLHRTSDAYVAEESTWIGANFYRAINSNFANIEIADGASSSGNAGIGFFFNGGDSINITNLVLYSVTKGVQAGVTEIETARSINVSNVAVKGIVDTVIDGASMRDCAFTNLSVSGEASVTTPIAFGDALSRTSARISNFKSSSTIEGNVAYVLNPQGNIGEKRFRIDFTGGCTFGTEFDNGGYGKSFLIAIRDGVNITRAELRAEDGYINLNAPEAHFAGTLLKSSTDNTASLGNGSYRWSQVYAATGSINTSDARLKTSLQAPTDALMRAWGKVSYQIFQFTDAVEKKGTDARLHVGLIAQQVIEAFVSEGLDATRYGLLCYDEWDDLYEDVEIVDQPEVLNEVGEVLTPAVTHVEHRKVLDAGNRYGIRYEEALALEAAYQRWQLNQLRKLVVGAA